MDYIKRIAAFLVALGDGIIGGLFKSLFCAVTGRDLDAEQAERDEAERREDAAARQTADLEARHEETLAAAARHLAEARAMRQEMAALSERRARHEAYGRAHTEAAEVRSSSWTREPEPESGAPVAPAPAY